MRESWKGAQAYIPALVIIVGLLPVTWIIPSTLGYVIAAMFVAGFLLLAMHTQRISLVRGPILIGFGIYWLILLIHFGVTQQLSVIPYVILVPLAILSLMMVAPPLVARNRMQFATGIVISVAGIVALGFLFLMIHLVGFYTPSMTGRRVLGLVDLRVSSIYGNSNHFGFVAAIGTLTGYYLWLETRRRIWIVTTLFIASGLLMSNARMAMIVTGLALVTMSIESRHQFSELADTAIQSSRQQPIVLPVGIVAVFAVGLTVLEGFITEAIESLLLRIEIWTTAMEPIIQNPFIGAAFGESLGLHNTYLEVVFQTGVIGGVAYLLALLAAFWYSFRRVIGGTVWDRYVFAILLTLLLTHFVETSTVGGLTTESLLFALFIGVAANRGELVFESKRMPSRHPFESGPKNRADQPSPARALAGQQITVIQQRLRDVRAAVTVEQQPIRTHSLGTSYRGPSSRKTSIETPPLSARTNRTEYRRRNNPPRGHPLAGGGRTNRTTSQRNPRATIAALLHRPFQQHQTHSLDATSEETKIAGLLPSPIQLKNWRRTQKAVSSLIWSVFSRFPEGVTRVGGSNFNPLRNTESSPLSAAGRKQPSTRNRQRSDGGVTTLNTRRAAAASGAFKSELGGAYLTVHDSVQDTVDATSRLQGTLLPTSYQRKSEYENYHLFRERTAPALETILERDNQRKRQI